MLRHSLTVGLMLALLGSAAVAQTENTAPEGRPMMPDFRAFADARIVFGDPATLDADDDGTITPDEIEAARAARFALLDADGDGTVTVDEIMAAADDAARAAREDALAKLIAAYDADQDGALQGDEMPMMSPRTTRHFDRLDTDGDGQISASEFAAGTLERRPDMHRRGPQHREQTGPRQMEGHPHVGRDHGRGRDGHEHGPRHGGMRPDAQPDGQPPAVPEQDMTPENAPVGQ